MTKGTADLWHAAGRAARDDRKRLVALQGVLWSGPVLVLGAFLARLPRPDPAAILSPFSYVVEPLRRAWHMDRDLELLGYVVLQGLLLCLLWGLFGGALYRLAAVDLARGRREDGRRGLEFARRRWRAFAGAKVVLALGVAVPLAVAAGLAAAGRLPGWFGGVPIALAAGAAVLLAIAAVVAGSVALMGGFLTGPTVASEDSDVFDAVTRAFTYAAAGLPRLLGLRLLFLGGVLLGTGWRLARALAVAGLAWVALRLGAGAGRLDRALDVLGGVGDRRAQDVLLAAALAVGAGSLFVLWLADLATRVCASRVAVYLAVRRAVDGVPLDRLGTPPRGPGHQGAEDAGFVEVTRVGDEE